MNTVNYKGHQIRFQDIGDERFFVLSDITAVFINSGAEVTPKGDGLVLRLAGQNLLEIGRDPMHVVTLSMAEELLILPDDLEVVLTNAAPFNAAANAAWLNEELDDTCEEFSRALTELKKRVSNILDDSDPSSLVCRVQDIVNYIEIAEWCIP